MGRQVERCANQEKKYPNNPCFANTCEHLDIVKQNGIPCLDGFYYDDKILEWLSLIENYFEFKDVVTTINDEDNNNILALLIKRKIVYGVIVFEVTKPTSLITLGLYLMIA